MSLSKFMEKHEQASKKNDILIMDGHNMIFRMLFMGQVLAKKDKMIDKDFIYYKRLLINSIFKSIEMFKPSSVIIALDSKHNWRKEIYKEYKANRSEARSGNADVNFEEFFAVSNSLWEDMKNIFKNIMFLQIDYCEADDIIAVLTKDVLKNTKVTVVTSDKDMHQLYKYNNYTQYDPIKRQIIKVIDPQKVLDIKIIMGDKGDNIPSIRKGCGPATATKILSEGIENYFTNDEIKQNYVRNKQLIDFDCIPESICLLIKNHYTNYKLSEFNVNEMFSFLMKHNLGNMVDDLTKFNSILKKIA